jgi:hypothetical protein
LMFDCLGLYPETAGPGSRKDSLASRSCYNCVVMLLGLAQYVRNKKGNYSF